MFFVQPDVRLTKELQFALISKCSVKILSEILYILFSFEHVPWIVNDNLQNLMD
jgi:hypothetical protein